MAALRRRRRRHPIFPAGSDRRRQCHRTGTSLAVSGRIGRIIALGPATGEERWIFDSEARIGGYSREGDPDGAQSPGFWERRNSRRRAVLPAGSFALPMTYMFDDRQYVVIASGGHPFIYPKPGDYLTAFALPCRP